MKPVKKYFFLGVLVIVVSILTVFIVNLVSGQQKERVLGFVFKPTPTPTPTLTPTPTPTSTPTPTPSPTPSPRPTPTPTITPTPTPFPQPTYNSEQINAFIERFGSQYGVDPNVLRYVAVCESNFNPAAINGPYAGLYQFSSITWKNNRQLMSEETNTDLRFNAEEAVQTAAFIISIGRGSIWPNCLP